SNSAARDQKDEEGKDENQRFEPRMRSRIARRGEGSGQKDDEALNGEERGQGGIAHPVLPSPDPTGERESHGGSKEKRCRKTHCPGPGAGDRTPPTRTPGQKRKTAPSIGPCWLMSNPKFLTS